MPQETKALVVEDRRWVRDLKRKALVFRSNWELDDILEASTLAEAIELANRFDLVLVSLDLNLKDSRGLETLQQFLAKTRVLPGRVYVVTADANDVALAEACEALQVAAVIYPGFEPWNAPGQFTSKQKEEIRDIMADVLQERFAQRDKLFYSEIEAMTTRIVTEQQKLVDDRRLMFMYRSVTVAAMGAVAWLVTTIGAPYLAQVLRDGFSASVGGR